MNSIQYYPCTLADLEQLVIISKTTFCDAFEEQNNPDDFQNYLKKAFSKEQLKSELLHADTDFYFVYLNTQLAAYFKLNRNEAQSDIKQRDSLELERIYVTENFQGLGLGKQLLKQVKKIAETYDKRFIWLGVWEHNTRAIAFYERHGFYKFGTHPYFIGADEQTDWLMRYDLP